MKGETLMLDLNDFFRIHDNIERVRRQCITDYWEEIKTGDIVAKLNATQRKYLFTIKQHGPCSLQTVMHYTGFSCSATSTAIDKLVRIGAVNRVRNEDNRREIIVSLSSEMDDHFKRIEALFRKRISAALSDCSSDELEMILRGAKILLEKFTG